MEAGSSSRDVRLTQTVKVKGAAQSYPAGHSFAMLAFLEELWPSAELVVTSTAIPAELREFLRAAPHPGLTILVKTPATAEALTIPAPFTKGYPIPACGAWYYLCQGGVCAQPVNSIPELETRLTQGR